MEKVLRCALIILALIMAVPAVSSADELDDRFAQHLELNRISREMEIAQELARVKTAEKSEQSLNERDKAFFDALEKETKAEKEARIKAYQHTIEMLLN